MIDAELKSILNNLDLLIDNADACYESMINQEQEADVITIVHNSNRYALIRKEVLLEYMQCAKLVRRMLDGSR